MAAGKSTKSAAGKMSRVTSHRLQVTGLTLLSATLLSLAFSSFNLEFLAWFGFVPLFFVLEKKNRLQSFFISYFCGFLFFAASMYWLVYVTIAGWFVLSLYQALYFGLFGLFFVYFLQPTTYRLPSTIYHLPSTIYIILPSVWVLLEYIRANFAGGIGWNLLGYSQYKNLPLIQIADITGVYGVSFLVMLMNVAAYNTIKMARKCYTTDSKFKIKGKSFKNDLKANPAIGTLVVLVLFLATLLYGHYMTTIYHLPSTISESLKVSIIQGNIPQKIKWDEKYIKYIIERYEGLTLKAAKEKPHLIIWPETAVPGFLNYDAGLTKWMKTVSVKIKTPILTGAPTISEKNIDDMYNSAILFSKDGAELGRYDKLHLVLLGEFIPLEKQFPFLRKIFPITGYFIPGKEYTVFNLPSTNYQLPTVAFSVLICFEDIFPGLVRQFVKRGVDFMVNITNDAWFGKSCSAYQHAANSVFRAIENRRFFVRSANTGLSCFIDKTGRIYEKVSKGSQALFVEGIKTAYVDAKPSKNFTFYTKSGDVFVFICVIILIVSILYKIYRKVFDN